MRLRESNQLLPTLISVMLKDGRLEKWSWIEPGDRPTLRIIGGGLEQVLEGGTTLVDAPNIATAYIGGDTNWSPLTSLEKWASNLIWIPVHRQVDTDNDIQTSGGLGPTTIAPTLVRLKDASLQQYTEFEQVLSSLVPTVAKVHVTHGSGTSITLRVSESERDSAQEAPRLDHAGGGVSELLYLISGIWLAPEGSTLLIEEPERGLHPEAQRKLVSLLTTHCADTGKQVFWTTHSPVMAPILSGTSTTLVRFDQTNHSQSMSVRQDDVDIVRKALGIRPSDIYQHKMILLVDGKSETDFFEEFIPALHGPDTAYGIYLSALDGDVDTKRSEVARTISLIAASSTELFIMADHDGAFDSAQTWIRNHINTPKGFDLPTRIHVWNCGLDEDGRDAEFEDNFSTEELILAANELAEGTKLIETEFIGHLASKPDMKTSKVLAAYYHESYEYGLSKPSLMKFLVQIALTKIRSNENRGTADGRYEFEVALDKALSLID